MLLVAAGLVFWRPWRSDMSARAVEGALPARIRTEYPRLPRGVRFHCARIRNDGSIVMKDVDYECEPVAGGRDATGFWVATSRTRITEIQPMG
jgi:hypothetical protein